MKTTTRYFIYGLITLISFTLLYLGLSYLRAQITYAHESQAYQEAILSTDTQIQNNSSRRNEIDEQIKSLKQEQLNLQSTNTQLRKDLTQQKTDYQDFLGFNSGR